MKTFKYFRIERNGRTTSPQIKTVHTYIAQMAKSVHVFSFSFIIYEGANRRMNTVK